MKDWCPVIKDYCKEDICVCYMKATEYAGPWCTYLKTNVGEKEKIKEAGQ